MTRLRGDERGQSAVIAVLFLTVLLGMTASVVDVGSWFRAQRQAQTQADAAALAGAQLLPDDPSGAISTAVSYAKDNGVAIDPSDVSFPASDTIAVKVVSPEPGFFSKIFGISSVTVHATAAARAYRPYEARFVAPIVVNKLHPDLSGPGCPCFGPDNQTTLPLGKTGAPGAFAMLDFDPSNGATGASTLASWIDEGYDQYLPLGGYYSDPGAKFNASDIDGALTDKLGDVLLFPVYDTLAGPGDNAKYHIIGWVGFHLTSFDPTGGNSGTLSGWFTSTIWDGLDALPGGTPGPDYGVRSVELVQ